jgi:hypothetical protein
MREDFQDTPPDIDYKTAVAIFQHVKGLDAQLLDLAKRQELAVKEMQAERREGRQDMLDAVEKAVEKSTRLIEAKLDTFRQEMANVNDNQEHRLVCVEDTLQTQDIAISSLQNLTKPIPDMAKDIETLKNKPGALAMSAWKRALAIAGALVLAAISALLTWLLK